MGAAQHHGCHQDWRDDPSIVPDRPVRVVSVERIGDQAINAVYRDPAGGVTESTIYRDEAERLEVETDRLPWSFDAVGIMDISANRPKVRTLTENANALGFVDKNIEPV